MKVGEYGERFDNRGGWYEWCEKGIMVRGC